MIIALRMSIAHIQAAAHAYSGPLWSKYYETDNASVFYIFKPYMYNDTDALKDQSLTRLYF